MIGLIKYKIDIPTNHWSFLGSPEEANAIPNEHKDQIHFLNNEGTDLVSELLFGSNMLGSNEEEKWNPFNKNYFNDIKKTFVYEGSEIAIKKWLYELGISFDRYVIVNGDVTGSSILMTWKMVIKYSAGLFFAHDIVIFDESLNWCLFYYHRDELYFGYNKIYNKELEYEKWLQVNEVLKKLQKN